MKMRGAILCICIVMEIALLTNADRFSGICPPSYPRRVVYNATGSCFEIGSQGPCGSKAVIASDPNKPNFGVCRCQDYGNAFCFGRPLLKYGEQCFFEFSQGPCRKGQWFVRNKYGYPECRKTPCPIIEKQKDLLASDYPTTDFYFTVGRSECFKTGSKAFCNPDERVYFLGTNPVPQCLKYDPPSCQVQPDYDTTSYDTDSFQPNQGLVAFGVPWDGI